MRLVALQGTSSRIDAYNIEDNTPKDRDAIITETRSNATSLYDLASRWVPFSLYENGVAAKSIRHLESKAALGDEMFENTKTSLDEQMNEFKELISAEAAQFATTVFTEAFEQEAKDMACAGAHWLYATIALAFLTSVTAIIFAFCLQPPEDAVLSVVIQQVGSKFVILGILIGATLWCGRNYRARMHQSVTTKHRQLSMQTIKAFHQTVDNQEVKDAVVLEAARAIYSNVQTGLVDGRQQDQSSRVIEIARAFTPKLTQ